eukprot:jgi/Ulvmu1/4047/UM019_0024.1
MKRKNRSSETSETIERTGQGISDVDSYQGHGLSLTHDQASQTWQAKMPHGVVLLAAGCFSLRVKSGAVLVRGAAINKADGTVTVASSKPTTCFRIAVPVRDVRVPLVMAKAHLASASFTLEPLVADCQVMPDASEMGILTEEIDSVEAWEQVLHDMTTDSASTPNWACVICGPKRSGKSTFARTLCNMLLQSHAAVALLEADCGQPQFGPAGLVSLTYVRSPLLVPPHLLLQQPDESILIGDISPQNNPITYLNAIRKLREMHSIRTPAGGDAVPLVVNTMGWVKGFGQSLVRDALLCVQPHRVAALQSGNPVRDLPCAVSWIGDDASSMHYQELPGIAMAAARAGAAAALKLQAHSATEERSARLHAWALATLRARSHSLASGRGATERAFRGRLAQTAADLCACRPVAVDLATVQVLPMFEGWGDAPATAMLNGSLVGLLRCDPSTPREVLLEALVNDPLLTCGLGLVHAVAPAAGVGGVAYIHTPAPLASLQGVGALCVCMLEVAKGLLSADDLTSPYLSLHCLTADASGSGTMKSRRNLVRAGQL